MLVQDSVLTLGQSIYALWDGVLLTIPGILVAIILFVIGWIVASILGRVVAEIVKAIKVDKALEGAGVGEVLRHGGVQLNSGVFFGALVKWFVVVAFLITSLEVVHLTQVTEFLSEVLMYLPNVIVAAIILIATAIVADFARRVSSGAAQAAQVSSAGLVGTIAKWAVWVLGFLTAFYQLGIAAPFMQVLFTGFVAALSLALGLAFGLGGKETAARVLDKTWHDISSK